jgi:hypothetical protein
LPSTLEATRSSVVQNIPLPSFGTLAGPLNLAYLNGLDERRVGFGAGEKGNRDYSWDNAPI